MHRFQISVFGSVALVFAVIGVNNNIYVPLASTKALATGWLLLAMVDILWVLYFTSEEDSLMLYLFNSLGSGGLSSPSRRRRTRTSTMMQPGGNGYPTNYASGVGSHDGYDTKLGGVGAYGSPAPDLRGQASFGGSLNDAAHPRSINSAGGGAAGSLRDQGTIGNISIAGVDNGPSSPLMAGVGAAGSAGGTSIGEATPQQTEPYNYKAKALYSCRPSPPISSVAYSLIISTDSANTEDPNEISFTKGEILEIVDKTGKWWQARKADGTQGSKLTSFCFLFRSLMDPPSCTFQLSANHLTHLDCNIFAMI